MNQIQFVKKNRYPDSAALKNKLGKTYKFWIDIRFRLEILYCPLNEEWNYYNPQYGWTLKILKKKRTLFFVTPHSGFFTVTFSFSEEAVDIIAKSDLTESLINKLLNARKYIEGRRLTIEVRSQEEIEQVLSLVAIKMNS